MANENISMSEHLDIVRQWASEIREIERVWIIGSRARGNHRLNSDLDVWVQAWSGWWAFEHKKWKDDLQARLRFIDLHLVEYQGENSPLAKRTGGQRILVYSKEGAT